MLRRPIRSLLRVIRMLRRGTVSVPDLSWAKHVFQSISSLRFLRTRSCRIAILAGIVVLAAAAPARADIEIWLSASTGTNNNPPLASDMVASALSGAPVSYTSPNFGAFSISVLVTNSNSPGSPTSAILTGNGVITNNTSKTATLYITLSDTGFTDPTTPPVDVVSSINGKVEISNAANKLTYWSYVNTDNTQNGIGGATFGPQNPSIVSGAFSDVNGLTLSSLSGPYSLTERFALTLGAGVTIDFSSSTVLTGPTAVPAPAGIVLALTGLPCLGLGWLARRRKEH